jgi:hypothetical protein
VSVRAKLQTASLLLAAITVFVGVSAAQTAPLQTPAENAFTDHTASVLLRQLSESLQGHSQKQFLALFDLGKMKEGTLFKQQIAAFFSQTESIRVHLNLAETSAEADNATIAVDAEMEVEPRSGAPSSRRHEHVTFSAANIGGHWKFIDVQPRSFFSLP